MKKREKQTKRKPNFISGLFRDIFVGGAGYQTVKGEKTPFPTLIVTIALVTTLLFLILMFSLIKLSVITSEIADMKKEITTLTSKKDKLLGEINHRYSFAEIEKTAAELGLAAENGQTVYLNPEQ